jgi:hypothetical protein
MEDDLQDLTSLNVDEQKNKLENLSKEELKELREKEERQTAIDNIDRELSGRGHDQVQEKDDESEQDSVERDAPMPQTAEDNMEDSKKADERSELERKVDYLIENCKTTSKEGFQEYDNQ